MKNYTITVNGNVYQVSVEEGVGAVPVQTAPVAVAPVQAAPVAVAAPVAPPVQAAPVEAVASTPVTQSPAQSGVVGSVKVNAPMPGKILAVKVSVGQKVKRGDVVVILEAMKMENEIVASADGTIASIEVASGTNVESGAVLVTLN